MTFVSVLVFSAAGAIGRWTLSRRFGWRGTMAANLAGALGLGIVVGSEVGEPLGQALAIGFFGAFTTVSGLAGDVAGLVRRSATAAAGLLACSIVAGVGLAWLGLNLAS